MITIKIQCPCGQKYAFDAEPVAALPDRAVQCPVCAADGTEAARNQIAGFAQSIPVHKLGLAAHQPAQSALPILAPTLPRRTPEGPRKTERRAASRKLVAGIGSGVLLCAVLWAAIAASHGPKRVVLASSAHFDDGFPHTPAEVQKWYAEPPAGQNGATFYQKGFDALQMPNHPPRPLPVFGNAEIPPPNASLPSSMRSDIGALLRANQTTLQYFKQGAQFQESRYAVDFSAGMDTLLMHLELLKRSSVLLELAALFHADAQDGRQAAEDLEVGLALADSLKSEPELGAQVIRTFGVTRSVIALEQCLNRCFLPSEALARLSQALRRMEDFDARGDGFNRGLAAERANCLAVLANPDKLLQVFDTPGRTTTKADREQLVLRLQKQPSLEVEAQFFKSAVWRILAARNRPFPERIQSDIVARDEVAEARSKKLVALEPILPPLTGRATQEGECLAELRLGATAVALEQYRRAHDSQFPATLAVLSPEYLPSIPLDPFQGRPLIYETKGLGYTLRSPEAKAGLGRHSQIRPRGLLIEVFAAPIPRP